MTYRGTDHFLGTLWNFFVGRPNAPQGPKNSRVPKGPKQGWLALVKFQSQMTSILTSIDLQTLRKAPRFGVVCIIFSRKSRPHGALMVHLGGQLVAFGAIMASWESKGGPRGAQCHILLHFECRKGPHNGIKKGHFFDFFLRCL